MTAGDDDYKVGYGKPPETSRFQKGQSGNPSGRPKGSKNTALAIHRVLNRTVQATVDGKRRNVPLSEAVAMTLSQRALAGDQRAAVSLLKLAASLHDCEADDAELDDIVFTAEQEKDLIEWVDFFNICEGLEVLGFIVRDSSGRPKLAQAAMGITLDEALANRDEDEIVYLRRHYLEGAVAVDQDRYEQACRNLEAANKKKRSLKRRR